MADIDDLINGDHIPELKSRLILRSIQMQFRNLRMCANGYRILRLIGVRSLYFIDLIFHEYCVPGPKARAKAQRYI